MHMEKETSAEAAGWANDAKPPRLHTKMKGYRYRTEAAKRGL